MILYTNEWMDNYTILYKFIGEAVHGAEAKKKKEKKDLTGEVETCQNSLITCQSDSVGLGHGEMVV
jgi:hypothetical protein